MRSTPRLSAVLVFAVSLSLIAGCASMENLATSPDTAKTRKGAGYGAAAGAVVGLLTGGGKLEAALLGAAIGGLAGGAIGNYQDRQEKQLREQLAGTGVEVVRQSENITLDVPGGLTFATNSANVNANFQPVLDKIAGTLVEYNQTVIEVAGHTDSTGASDYNLALSERRAKAVAAYLSGKGVPGQRMLTIGGGEEHPVAAERHGGRARAESPRRDHDRTGGEEGLTR